MPPKRKIGEMDDQISSSVSKMTKLIGSKPTTGDVDYKAPIKYDEYMEGGIPDSLLAGLGFSEDVDNMTRVSSEEEKEESDEEEDVVDERVLEQRRVHQGGAISKRSVDVKTATVGSSSPSSLQSIPAPIRGGLGAPGGITPQQYLDIVMGKKPVSSVSTLTQHQSNKQSSPLVSVAEIKSNSSVRTPTSAVGREAQGGNALLSRGSRESSGMSRSTSNQSAAMIQAAALEAIRSMNITSQSNTPPASHGPATTGRSFTNSSGRGGVTHSSGGRGSGSRSYQIAPRTVTKGNIVYERMATGEVIASLVKDNGGLHGSGAPAAHTVTGRPSQSLQHSGGGPHMQSRGTPQYRSAVPPPSHRNSSIPPPAHRNTSAPARKPTSDPTVLSAAPDNCPINEYNVSDVLERSIKATQSMRLLLTSLRDDLKRVGAGAAAVVTTPEQVRKKQEVADKLSKAYATYKQAIEDIETGVQQRSGGGGGGSNPPNNVSHILGGAMGALSNQRGGVAVLGGNRTRPQWRGRGGATNYSGSRGVPPPAHQGSYRGNGRGGHQVIRPISVANPLVGNGDLSNNEVGVKEIKTSPNTKVAGQTGRGRSRKRSSRDVIELSDSEEDEDKMILGCLPKDLLSERRSRDQRAADRAALKSASIVSAKAVPPKTEAVNAEGETDVSLSRVEEAAVVKEDESIDVSSKLESLAETDTTETEYVSLPSASNSSVEQTSPMDVALEISRTNATDLSMKKEIKEAVDDRSISTDDLSLKKEIKETVDDRSVSSGSAVVTKVEENGHQPS